jgi:hypothetical protein
MLSRTPLEKGNASCDLRNLIYTIYARYCRHEIYTVHLAYGQRRLWVRGSKDSAGNEMPDDFHLSWQPSLNVP